MGKYILSYENGHPVARTESGEFVQSGDSFSEIRNDLGLEEEYR